MGHPSNARACCKPGHKRYRPKVEMLESRCLPRAALEAPHVVEEPVAAAEHAVLVVQERVRAERAATTAFVRVNQVGYVTDSIKQARLMAGASETGATFRVVDDTTDLTIFTGTVGASLGSWSTNFPNVHLLDFSAVTTPGEYHIEVTGPINASSPSFRIDTGANLYADLLPNAAFFYLAQQDGPDVDPDVLNRQPSHLADQNAFIYRKPTFINGVIQPLVRLGGRIDVSGGWFDAGDYLKFVETTSYTVIGMLTAVRDHPALLTGGNADFAAEAKFGLEWLLKMWNDDTRTLYYQVGIGDGNGTTILADHDVWRLPEADDQLDVQRGDPEFFIKFRPVFRAGAPGSKISPNLAGRMAAAFALGFQVYRQSDPDFAAECLLAAQHIFDLAKTRDVTKLLTASPHNFYPETEWRDDMELGATELFNATSQGGLPGGLPHTDPLFYLQKAAKWASRYIQSPTSGDSLNLYDVSGLAHYELHRAITAAGNPSGLAVTQDALVDNLQSQLDAGVAQAQSDPFGFGLNYADGGDNSAHALGFALEASFYEELTGDATYDRFAADQLGFVLGENAWGSSFIIGAGSTFTHCPQHQVANLAGTLDGTFPNLLGAVVNGPAILSEFVDLGTQEGANACPSDGSDPFDVFTNAVVRYRDNVDAFRSTEPAIDYTALTPLLFARQVEGPGAPLIFSSSRAYQREERASSQQNVEATPQASGFVLDACVFQEPAGTTSYHRRGRGEQD